MFLTLTGAAILATSALGMHLQTNKEILRRAMVRTFRAYKLDRVRIVSLDYTEYGFRSVLTLPPGVTADDFEYKALEGLEQESRATGTSFKHLYGNLVEIKFGYKVLEGTYSDSLKKPNHPLAVPLLTPFGRIYLDFADESTTHVLIGGATRMGKSVLLRLIMTHIYNSLGGKCNLTICDNKVTDVHMFQGLPGVKIAETEGEVKLYLDDILQEGYRRKALLKAKGNVVDVKSYRKQYPNDEPMPPMFLVIDEYGRFSENKDIQEKVIEIAETMGYLDVHLVIASQRPDAGTVLKPRIRANLLTRIAFTTADEANSKIILDIPDAAKLKKIKGRAIYLDGFPQKVQVPYMSEEQSMELLAPYRSEKVNDEPRQDVDNISEALPSFVSGPLGEIDLPRGSSPASDDKPNRKTTRKRRLDSSNPAST